MLPQVRWPIPSQTRRCAFLIPRYPEKKA
jgi:hypothetical protein